MHAEIKMQIASIIQLTNEGMSTAEIAAKMSAKTGSVSRDTILRALKKAGVAKPRGGYRPGAGRKSAAESVTEAELRRQQAIDCSANSWEVGIGRKKLGDKDWFNYARTAFRLTAAGKYARKEYSNDIPAKLPRQVPNPR